MYIRKRRFIAGESKDCKFELDPHVILGVKGWLFLTTWSNNGILKYGGNGLTSPNSHHGPHIYLRSSSIEAGVSRKPFQVFENLGNSSQEGKVQTKTESGQDLEGQMKPTDSFVTWPWLRRQCIGDPLTRIRSWSVLAWDLQSQCTWKRGRSKRFGYKTFLDYLGTVIILPRAPMATWERNIWWLKPYILPVGVVSQVWHMSLQYCQYCWVNIVRIF